jgi:hypothetical protein
VSRSATRLMAVVGAVCVTVCLTAGPALAEDIIGPSEGHDPGDSLGVAGALLLYVGIPVAVLGLVAALVFLPGLARGSRYRPARGWAAQPVWFAGPVAPEQAIASAQAGDVVRGGASGSW